MNAPLPRVTGRRATRHAMAAVSGLLLLLVLPGGVAGHAELVSSTPAADAMLTEPPVAVVLTFDEAVVGNSSFQVLDASGATIASGVPDPAAPTTMRADLPALEPGVYEVQWTSVAEDTDIERGTFTFTVVEPTPPPPTPTPAPTDAPTAAPTPTVTPSPVPSPSPSPSPGGGDGAASSTDILLPIIALAVLIGAGLLFLLRRRGPA